MIEETSFSTNFSRFDTSFTSLRECETKSPPSRQLSHNFAKLEYLLDEGPYTEETSEEEFETVIHAISTIISDSKELAKDSNDMRDEFFYYFSESKLSKLVETLIVSSFLERYVTPSKESWNPDDYEWPFSNSALQRLCYLVELLYQIPFDSGFQTTIAESTTLNVLKKLKRTTAYLAISIDRYVADFWYKDTFQISSVQRLESHRRSASGSADFKKLVRDSIVDKVNIIDLMGVLVVSFGKPQSSIIQFLDQLPVTSYIEAERLLQLFRGFSNCSQMAYTYYFLERNEFPQIKQAHCSVFEKLTRYYGDFGGTSGQLEVLKECLNINNELFSSIPLRISTPLETVKRKSLHYEYVTQTGHYKKYLGSHIESPKGKGPKWAAIFYETDDAVNLKQSAFSDRISSSEDYFSEPDQSLPFTEEKSIVSIKVGFRQRIRNLINKNKANQSKWFWKRNK